jgi:hypothetical protein
MNNKDKKIKSFQGIKNYRKSDPHTEEAIDLHLFVFVLQEQIKKNTDSKYWLCQGRYIIINYYWKKKFQKPRNI